MVTHLLTYWDEVVFKGGINKEKNYDTDLDTLLTNLEVFELDEDLGGVDGEVNEVLHDGIVVSNVIDNPLEPGVPQPKVIKQFNSPCTDVEIPQELTLPCTHSIALNHWSGLREGKEIQVGVQEASRMGL